MSARNGTARKVRHLLSIADLSNEEIRWIVARGADFAAERKPRTRPLDRDIVGLYFEHTSTRTRTSFASGALRLGASLVSYGPEDLQTNTGETLGDTARALSGMLDVLVARTSLSAEGLHALTAQRTMSVVNAMSTEEHPTQALADLTTLHCHFGKIDGLRILYLGEGNNTAASLTLALSRFPGAELHLRTPAGYGLAANIAAAACHEADRNGARVIERHDMGGLPPGVDVVYTTRWQTTGTAKADPRWRDVFLPFRVHTGLWQGSPSAVFMHDLPAHRGEEVTAEVLDGTTSIAFEQAEHKLYSAMAVLEWCRQSATRARS